MISLKQKEKELLKMLKDANDWVPAVVLSRRLGVTKRSVRNYVKSLIIEGKKIQSSKNGYFLERNCTNDFKIESSIRDRKTFILSKLLTKNEVNIFDISSDLAISDSLLLNEIMPGIKKDIKKFNLKLVNQNYNISLRGEEKAKRKLIGNLVQKNAYGYSNSIEVLEDLFPKINIKEISNEIYRICQQEENYINDYSINNLMLHMLIMFIRLSMGYPLSHLVKPIGNHFRKIIKYNSHIKKISSQLIRLFEDSLKLKMSNEDEEQIVLLTVLSFNHDTTFKSLINSGFTNEIKDILKKVAIKYCISDFDEDFVNNFVLHIFMAKNRIEHNYSYPDPIGNQIKQNFSLVYDMSVFFAQEFERSFNLKLTEDEISFVAIHFATYFSENRISNFKIRCALVNENYNHSSKILKRMILGNFKQSIEIVKSVSLNHLKDIKDIELVISTEKIGKVATVPYVMINQLVKNDDLEKIQKAITSIKNKKILEKLLIPKLYFHITDQKIDSPEKCIKFLGQHCMDLDYVDEKFINDVLLREKMSSTAFTDCLAIPHAANAFAKQSFIAIIQSDFPINWKDKNINIVMLIGLNQKDMDNFNEAFNLIISAFQSESKVNKLLKADRFKEFENILL